MPTFGGVLFRKADHLVARNAKPGDSTHLGQPIPLDRKVVVLRKDCDELEDGSIDPYTADPLPQIPSEESARRIYGQWRKQRNRDGQWVDGDFVKEYYTCPVYRVEGSKVWLGTIYSKNDPRLEALEEAEDEDPQPA